MNLTVTIVITIVAIAIAVALWLFIRKQRSERLQSKFGPEYDRAVGEMGRQRAEAALEDRSKRVRKFAIRSLSDGERAHFADEWRREQTRFVDNPADAVAGADRLLIEVMSARGYPMGEFDQRAEDISVDHPQVVQNYRAAHDIALRDSKKLASTEDLRQAMVHYRALFEDLLEEHLLLHEQVQK